MYETHTSKSFRAFDLALLGIFSALAGLLDSRISRQQGLGLSLCFLGHEPFSDKLF